MSLDYLSIKVEVRKGANIYYACKEAIHLSWVLDQSIRFEFNGIEITATSHSDVHALLARYDERLILAAAASAL